LIMLELFKRHLRYGSVEEWKEREKVASLRHPGNPGRERKLARQVKELRAHLWKRHLAQLTPEERKEIKEGKHPSLSHTRIDQAKPIFEEFRAKVAPLPFVAEVTMVARQMEHIVIRVKLSKDVGWRVWQEQIPPYYRGFEVIVTLAGNSRPALTRESAATLIPDGMSEAEVYEQLGTNATVSLGKNGQKYLSYSFRFSPTAGKVEPKIDAMTVVLANGKVVERQFG
jgi:hypothetical protein